MAKLISATRKIDGTLEAPDPSNRLALAVWAATGLLEGHTLRPSEDTDTARADVAELLRLAAESDRWGLPRFDGGTVAPTPEQIDVLREAADLIEKPPDEGEPASVRLEGTALIFDPLAALTGDQFVIPSSGIYRSVQKAIESPDSFVRVEGSRFPRAELLHGATGSIEMRQIEPTEEFALPPEEADALAAAMWEQRRELSDRDADTLDALAVLFLGRAGSPTARVPIYVDELLEKRGLRKKRAGSGRRGGFMPEQRADLFRSLLHLNDLWIDVQEATVYETPNGKRRARPKVKTLQSRAFVLTDRFGQKRLDGTMEVEAVLVTPGTALGYSLFGPGRQTALLSARALEYDPYRHHYEKRLTRYLAYHWRVNAEGGAFVHRHRISKLLEEIRLEIDAKRPTRAKDRLEKCLDRLHADGVIGGWQYDDGWRDEDLPRRGWGQKWLDARVLIEAPDDVKDHYLTLAKQAKDRPRIAPGERLGDRLRRVRKDRGLTQMQTAEQLGITESYVSRIEGGVRPSRKLQQRLEGWIEGA